MALIRWMAGRSRSKDGMKERKTCHTRPSSCCARYQGEAEPGISTAPGVAFYSWVLTREREMSLAAGVETSNEARTGSGAVSRRVTQSFAPPVAVWGIQNAPPDAATDGAFGDEMKRRL